MGPTLAAAADTCVAQAVNRRRAPNTRSSLSWPVEVLLARLRGLGIGRCGAAVLATRLATGPPFYQPPWSPMVVGMVLDDGTDWDEVAEPVTESYRLLRSPEAEAPP